MTAATMPAVRVPSTPEPQAGVEPLRRRAHDDEPAPAPATPGVLAAGRLAGETLARYMRDELVPRAPEARDDQGALRRRASDEAASGTRRGIAERDDSRCAVGGLTRLVSISEIAASTTEIDVHVLASVTGLHHRRMDVTGLLIRTGSHFVQIAEGRAEALAIVMRRIEAEPHHRAMRILSNAPIAKRRFDRWATAVVRDEALVGEIAELHRSGRIGEHLMSAIVDRL